MIPQRHQLLTHEPRIEPDEGIGVHGEQGAVQVEKYSRRFHSQTFLM